MTLRWRLTLLYAALFVLCGALLLVIAYTLVRDSLADQPTPPGKIIAVGPVRPDGTVQLADGRVVGTDQYRAERNAEQARNRAALDGYHRDVLSALLTRDALALAAVAPAALALGWVASGHGLRPLRRLTATARTIANAPPGDGLHVRLGPRQPGADMRELAGAFDEMLGRLEAGFAAQRRFVANAAHELRTPVTIERTVVDVELAGPQPDLPAVRERLLDANRRQTELINGLLVLARADQAALRREPVRLDELVSAELDAAVTDLAVRPSLAPTPVSGDRVLLGSAVRNLVGNAIRYNEPGGWIEVSTVSRNGRALLCIANTGPPIPADLLPELFEPFRRGTTERTGAHSGSGLGLSIVRAVALAHGGTVSGTCRTGGGLLIQLELPSAAG